MTKFIVALIFMATAQTGFASVWKYNSVKCDSEAATTLMSKKPDQTHFIYVYAKKKLIEFRSIYKGDSSKSERFFYQYAKKDAGSVALQKAEVKLSRSQSEITDYEINANEPAFSYKMSFDIDSLSIGSKVTTAGGVVNCSTLYDLDR